MAFFKVTVKIILGEYEKYVTTVRKADCKADAEYEALAGETHNEIMSREDYDNGAEWWDDYMVYQVYSCVEISEQTYMEMQ